MDEGKLAFVMMKVTIRSLFAPACNLEAFDLWMIVVIIASRKSKLCGGKVRAAKLRVDRSLETEHVIEQEVASLPNYIGESFAFSLCLVKAIVCLPLKCGFVLF